MSVVRGRRVRETCVNLGRERDDDDYGGGQRVRVETWRSIINCDDHKGRRFMGVTYAVSRDIKPHFA